MHPIKKYLHTKGIKVKDFANEIGVTREYLHSIISGIRKPHPETAIAIEKATNGEIRAEWLIFPEKYAEEIKSYIENKELEEVR